VRRRDSSIQADLEFNGVAKRAMQLELLFDGYEDGASVEPDMRLLEALSDEARLSAISLSRNAGFVD
jgi:hypothetical protein